MNRYYRRRSKEGIAILWVIFIIVALIAIILGVSEMIWRQFQTNKLDVLGQQADLISRQGALCGSLLEKRFYNSVGFVRGMNNPLIRRYLECARVRPEVVKMWTACPANASQELIKAGLRSSSGSAQGTIYCVKYIMPRSTAYATNTTEFTTSRVMKVSQPCAVVWAFQDDYQARSLFISYGYSSCKAGTNLETATLLLEDKLPISVKVTKVKGST